MSAKRGRLEKRRCLSPYTFDPASPCRPFTTTPAASLLAIATTASASKILPATGWDVFHVAAVYYDPANRRPGEARCAPANVDAARTR
jgi:hypothetical protein